MYPMRPSWCCIKSSKTYLAGMESERADPRRITKQVPLGHVKDGLNAGGQAVRATSANRCRGWEWTDLQTGLLSSRLAEVPQVITYAESVDAESCKYSDIEPGEHKGSSCRAGHHGGEGRIWCLCWKRAAQVKERNIAEIRGGKEEIRVNLVLKLQCGFSYTTTAVHG